MSELVLPLHDQIRRVLLEAQSSVPRAVNTAMVHAYFEIGRLIVEDEQHGHARAEYGEKTLVLLSDRLTAEFGRGFFRQNLQSVDQGSGRAGADADVCQFLRSGSQDG